jgi:hypothetical protein
MALTGYVKANPISFHFQPPSTLLVQLVKTSKRSMDFQRDSLCFPGIPEDIARLIFEVLVEDDKCRPIYALVSKQVQRW